MNEIIKELLKDIASMLVHLQVSVRRVPTLNPDAIRDEEDWEPFDAMCARFERVIDVMSNQLFVSVELYWYGDKSVNTRDRFLRMEKQGYLNSVDQWFDMRISRNKIAHAYVPSQLRTIYSDIIRSATLLQDTYERIVAQFNDEKISKQRPNLLEKTVTYRRRYREIPNNHM